jgi:hypothetical protein
MTPLNKTERTWITALLCVGPVLLLVACTVFGVTEVHSSTDTYIGLAGGRSVLESTDGFPVADTYSYTFNGKPWLNQNWLTHVWHYWLYRDFGPDAVIWGTWAMSACIVVFAFMAVWMRSKSPLGALLAASVVAVGCRDFISARPATTGFFAISAMWMLVCALQGQGQRRRVWPLAGMFVLLLAWGCAHGSFVFGYVIFAMYAGYWGLIHVWRAIFAATNGRPPLWVDAFVAVVAIAGCAWVVSRVMPHEVLDDLRYGDLTKRMPDLIAHARFCAVFGTITLAATLFVHFLGDRKRKTAVAVWQLGAIGGILLLSFVLTLAFGPFHWENFVHGREVGESKWRSVSEWLPPYWPGNAFPPVGRVLTILSFAAWGLLIVAGARIVLSLTGRRDDVEYDGPRPHVTAFDVLAVGIGLIMTIFARRFAPVLLVFAAPTVTTWMVVWLRTLPRPVIRWTRYAVVATAWILLLFVPGIKRKDDTHWNRGALGAASYALVDRVFNSPDAQPEDGLLERVTRYDATPARLVEYLMRNKVEANVYTEWTQAGILMFFAPNSRVYMDGRAQQVYNLEHYNRYLMAQWPYNRPPPESWYTGLYEELDRTGTDMVLLRASPGLRYFDNALQQSYEWVFLLVGGKGTIYVRRGCEAHNRFRAAAEQGTEWRPESPDAIASRGFLWVHTEPELPQRALDDWNAGVERSLWTGRLCFVPTVTVLLHQDRAREAARYVQAQGVRLARTPLSEQQRTLLQQQLAHCATLIKSSPKRNGP